LLKIETDTETENKIRKNKYTDIGNRKQNQKKINTITETENRKTYFWFQGLILSIPMYLLIPHNIRDNMNVPADTISYESGPRQNNILY